MITCKELRKSFANPRDMFLALKASKQSIVNMKKAAVKHTDDVFMSLQDILSVASKSGADINKEINYGDTVYPVINTCWWLDSHKDVHIPGIWEKSAKEQEGKTFYVLDHQLSVDKVIAYPENVTILVKTVAWANLGQPYNGTTEALIFGVKLTDDANEAAYKAIKARRPLQNSVRMQYVRLDLAINSTDNDFKEEKRIWDKYASSVVNQDALKDGYFWPVYEAKIFKEGSAVLFGSNEATPIQSEMPKHGQPSDDTGKPAAVSTGSGRLKEYNNILKQLKSIK